MMRYASRRDIILRPAFSDSQCLCGSGIISMEWSIQAVVMTGGLWLGCPMFVPNDSNDKYPKISFYNLALRHQKFIVWDICSVVPN